MLYVVEDRYPPFRADVVDLFARGMAGRGFHIDWVMRRGPEARDVSSPAIWHGQRVFLPPAWAGRGKLARLVNALLSPLGALRLVSLALSGHYDIVQVRDRIAVAPMAWLASRLCGARFVFWMSYPYGESKIEQARSGYARRPGLTRLKGHVLCWLLYRVVLPRADHVFVQSERMKEDVAREGIAPDRMTAVPMGIRVEQVGTGDDARAPDTAAPLLLYLGVIMRLRDTQMLVRVLARVRIRYPGARLRYVGEGQTPQDRAAVEAVAADLGLSDAVEITGFLPMEQAWGHVREADICFSPFQPIPVLLSTSPTKLVEYLAMAKCVVANEHPEQSKVLAESGTGRAVAWGDEAFADEVLRLLDDPGGACAMAARGPDWVRANRTYDVIACALSGHYRRLLAPDPQVA